MLIDHHVATAFSIPGPLCPDVHVSDTALSWLGRELDLPGGLQGPPGQISLPHETEFFQVWDCAVPIRLGTHQDRDAFILSLPDPPPLSTSASPVLSGRPCLPRHPDYRGVLAGQAAGQQPCRHVPF